MPSKSKRLKLNKNSNKKLRRKMTEEQPIDIIINNQILLKKLISLNLSQLSWDLPPAQKCRKNEKFGFKMTKTIRNQQ